MCTKHKEGLCFFTLSHKNTRKKKITPLFIQNGQCHTAALPGGWKVLAALLSHTREISPCWKTPRTFPPFPADSKCLLPPERKSKPNCVQPHPSGARSSLWHQPSLRYLLTGEHPQGKTVPKIKPISSQRRRMESWVWSLLQKQWQKYQLFCWRQMWRSAWTVVNTDSCLSG